MKKSLIFTLAISFVSSALFAQGWDQEAFAKKVDQYYKDEWKLKLLTPEQIKQTQEAAPKKLFVKPKKARNILVYTRTDGFRHAEGIPAWNAVMSAMEKNFAGQWKVTYTEDRDEFKKENIKKYDCIVFNNSTGGLFTREYEPLRQKMSGEQKKQDEAYAKELLQNIIDYVKDGGGVMALHAGCDAGHGSEYVTMMGGLFAGHPWGAGNDPVTVLVEDPGHILLKDLWPENEFQIQDEIYTFLDGYDREKQRVQLALDFDRSPKNGGGDPMKDTRRKDKDFGLTWCKTYEKGRIFYGAFGHRLDVFFRNPKICEYYMRGIQFACGDIDNVPTAPLGKEAMYKAEAAAAVNGITSLRDIDFDAKGKNNQLNRLEPVFFRAYQAITSSATAASQVEKICVAELKAKTGTLRYKKMLSELLQVTGANSSAVEIGEIIVRDASDPANRIYTESLFISLARTKDKAATAVLQKLLSSNVAYYKADALTALSYQNPEAALKAGGEVFAKAGSDEKMAITALGAIARAGTPASVAALANAYKAAKSDKVKLCAAEYVFANESFDSAAALAFAKSVYADQKAIESLRTLAAINLVKNGQDIKQDVTMESIIRFLGNFKDVKIPASLALDKLPDALRSEMIYALLKRGEGYDKIVATVPESGATLIAMVRAVAVNGKIEDTAILSKYANLLDKDQMRAAAFELASIQHKGKLDKFTDLSQKLEGPAADFIGETMRNLDASASVEHLFAIVKSNADDKSKSTALKTLENAVLKNAAVFVTASEIYPSAADSLKRPLMGLMVACSRRDCDDTMIAAATKLLGAVKTPSERNMVLRFALANNSDAGVKMCLTAYKSGMKKEALAELAKWNNASALDPLVALASASANNAEKKEIQATIVSVLAKSGEVNSAAADYVIKSAVDPKDAKIVSKLKRLNLGNAKIEKFKNGWEGTAMHGAHELKNAVDGNLGSRYTTGRNREPGQWIQFELPKTRTLSGIVLDLGSSKGDGITEPKVYAGETMEDFDEVEIKFTKGENGEDVLTFTKPKKVKMFRIENGGSQGGWWSIHEVVLVDDPSTFKDMKPMPNGMTAASSENSNNLKQAFDGNIDSRWDTSKHREPGMWFQIGLQKSTKLESIKLELGNSTGDRVLDPKVYIGETIETMKPAKFKYIKDKTSDTIKFEGNPSAKFIRIENTKDSGGYWSIHEFKLN